MYTRDELAEVHDDLPQTPLFGLIDHVLDLLTRGDEAELQSFRAAAAQHATRPTSLVPTELIEALKPLLDLQYPDQPFEWHVQRLALRVSARLHPEPHWKAKDAYKRHEVALRPLVEREPAAFLLPGLRLERRDERAWGHILDWIGRDFDAIFCLPMGPDDLAAISQDHVCLCACAVLTRLLGVATPDPVDPATLVITSAGALSGSVEWLGKVLQTRPEVIPLVDVDGLPA